MNVLPSLRSLGLLTLLCVAPLLLLACDSGGSNGGDSNSNDVTGANDDTFSIVSEGSFSATITKDGNTNTVSGGALFGEGEDTFTGGAAFVIYMLAGEKQTDDGTVSGDWAEIVIGDRNDVSAPTQTGSDAFNAWNVSQIGLGPLLFSSGQEGSLTITSVSDSELKGEFELLGLEGETVAEGTFTAKPTANMAQVQCAPDCD